MANISEIRMSVFKSEIVSSRQNLKNEVVLQKRANLKKQVVLYEQKFVEDANPPQIGFPEEIWLTIFEKLDIDCLRNCYNTCCLFRRYLEPLIGNIMLFTKVLPILVCPVSSHHPTHLSSNDLLKCRLVSKTMSCWMDNFIESQTAWMLQKFRNQDIPKNNISLLPALQNRSSYPMKREMLAHSRNPFVGRAVNFQAYVLMYDERRSRELGIGLGLNDTVLKQKDLETSGNHIWFLCLFGEPYPKPYSQEIHQNEVFSILHHCSNLRRFEIRGINRTTRLYTQEWLISKVFQTINLPHLSSLVLTTPPQCQEVNTNFVLLQNELIKKFSGQLKELRVTHWTLPYSQHDWSKLRILQVQKCDSIEKLENICLMNAVNIKELSLTLSGRNENKSLKLLLQTIHSFPHLEDLTLEFDSEWKILEQEILEIPVTLPDVCSKSLKRLHIRTGFCDDITYSFLLYFPFLEHVHISYGCSGMDSENDMNKSDWIEHLPKPLLQEALYLKSEKTRKCELLEIREYLYCKKEKIRQSPVWNILPFLRNIKITEAWMNCDDSKKCSETRAFRMN